MFFSENSVHIATITKCVDPFSMSKKSNRIMVGGLVTVTGKTPMYTIYTNRYISVIFYEDLSSSGSIYAKEVRF